MSNYITITTCTVWHVVWDEVNKVIIMTYLALSIASSMYIRHHSSDVHLGMSPIKMAASILIYKLYIFESACLFVCLR